MARAKVKDSARVSLGLKISEADAARIDEVLTRPEFAGWTRAQWCREIIRTALRYYAGDPPAPGPGQARTPAPAAAPPVPPAPAVPTADGAPVPAVGEPGPDGEPTAGAAGPAEPAPLADGEPWPGRPDAPEPPARTECPHPAEARDWQTGTCAACGAILWD